MSPVRYFLISWRVYDPTNGYDGGRIGLIKRAICLFLHQEDHYHAWGTVRCHRCYYEPSKRASKDAAARFLRDEADP